MTPSVLKPFKLTLLIIVVLSVAVALWIFYVPLVQQRIQLSKELTNLYRENDQISNDIAERRGQQTDFVNDPEYIELIGRREGLVRKNEVVFDFNQPPPRSRR